MTNHQEWFLPTEMTPGQLVEVLSNETCAINPHQIPLLRTYYDTFDGRLYRAGLLLIQQGAPVETLLTTIDGSILHRCTDPIHPGMLDTLPKALQLRLVDSVEMRRLLPRFHLTAQGTDIAILNKEEKTVCRLHVLQAKGRAEGDQDDKALQPQVTLQPIRGYDKALKRMTSTLTELYGPPSQETLLNLLSEATGHPLKGISSRFQSQVTFELNAQQAVKQILRQLLDIMERNEDGMKQNLDTEFLHDFRVAVRRSRAAIGLLKGALPEAIQAHFREEFAWLGTLTSPLRDLDVYLLHLPDYQQRLSPDMAIDLVPFEEFLHAHQKKERRRLLRGLKGARYQRLKQQWRTFLETAETQPAPEAEAAVQSWAQKRLRKVFNRVYRDGEAIQQSSPPEALHDLRKSCKKLRYLLEFFAPLLPQNKVQPLIQNLKKLQDNLGTYQDLCVQTDALIHFGQQMTEEGRANPGTLMAMGVLVEGLRSQQVHTRDCFEGTFALFSSPPVRALVHDTIHWKPKDA